MILGASLFSCSEHGVDPLLEKAGHYLPAYPDSADSVLRSIMDYKKLNDSDKALYGLLRTYTDNRLHKAIKSDSLIRPAYLYYLDKSDGGETDDSTLISRYASSCYYLGLYYSNCDSIKQCEDLMRQSIKFSEKCHDWHTCYLSHCILGVQMLWSDPEYSLYLFKKALTTYNKIDDDENNKALILIKIASAYTVMSDFENALDCYHGALNICEKNNYSKTRNEIYMGISGLYWHEGVFDKAIEYARKGIATAEGATLANSQLSLVRCYIDADSLSAARNMIGQVCLDTSDYINKYLKQRYLTDISLCTNDYKSLSESIDSAYQCMEDRFFHLERERAEYCKNFIDELSQKELLKEKHERKIRTISFFILLFCLFSFFLFLWLRYRYINEKQKRLNFITNQRLQHSILLNEKYEAEKLIQNQKEIIQKKTSQICTIQRHLLNRLEKHNAISYDMTNLSDKLWRDMEELLNETDNDFVKTLKSSHPDIKDDDVRLCMLIKLKETNNMIGMIFGITPSAVKKRKAVIKKTIFNVFDPHISLEDIIENM